MSLARELEPALAAVRVALEASRLAPERPARFLREWPALLERATKAARGDASLGAVAFAVAEAIPALDELAFALRRTRRLAPVGTALAGVHAILAPRLREASVQVFPTFEGARDLPALEGRAHGTLGLDASKAIEVEVVPGRDPGRILALERRGIVSQGSLVTRARVHVASGRVAPPRVAILEAAVVALEAAAPSPDDFRRLQDELDRAEKDDAVANGEAAVRFAVTALERAGAVAEARAAALGYLRSQGIAPLALAPGERFDPERHPASCFERQLARGGTRGTVIATRVTGFRDARGVVLGRAVVVVSE